MSSVAPSPCELLGQGHILRNAHTNVKKSAYFMIKTLIWPRREKTFLRGFANSKGADQPAHPRSLISAFVNRVLERIIS